MKEVFDIINTVSNLAGQANPRRAGDYTQDGLIFCGLCHTPKQCRIELCGRKLVVNCLCDCAGRRREEREAKEREAKKARLIAEIRKDGFPERGTAECRFALDDGRNPKLMQAAKHYADNFDGFKREGKGLVLYGGTGCGKTFAAACICSALIDRLVPCLMTNITRISNLSQSHFEDRQEYFDQLSRFDLLILDDLSAERRSEYRDEVVYSVIDARCRAKLPLIVTTNLTKDDFNKPADPFESRIRSRLYEMCRFVNGGDHDRRRDILREYNAQLKQSPENR